MTLLAMSCDITSHGAQPQTSPGCLLSPTRSAGRSTLPTDWIRHHRCRRDSAAWVRHGGARSPCPWRLPFSRPTEFVAEKAALSGAGRMAWKLSQPVSNAARRPVRRAYPILRNPGILYFRGVRLPAAAHLLALVCHSCAALWADATQPARHRKRYGRLWNILSGEQPFRLPGPICKPFCAVRHAARAVRQTRFKRFQVFPKVSHLLPECPGV